MKQKKFQHSKEEICKICNKTINTEIDFWAVMIDYEGNKKYEIGFYHRDCLNDLIKGQVRILENKWKEKMSNMVVNIIGKARERGLIPA